MAANAYIKDVYTKNGIRVKVRVTKGTITPGMTLRLGNMDMKVKDIKIQRTKFEKALEGELVELNIENGDYHKLIDATRSEVTFTESSKKPLEDIKKTDEALDFNEITVDEMKEKYVRNKKKL